MIVARFLQGVGVCSMMISGYACIHETYEDKQAIKILTVMSSISIVAPMIGPVIGGYLALIYNWRIVFWILLIGATILLILLYFYMPDASRTFTKYLSVKSIFTSYAKLLKNKLFVYNSLCFGMGYTCIMLWISVSPFLLMQNYHMDTYNFGLTQLPIFGAFMLGTITTNYFINKIELKKIIKYGFFLVSLGLMGILASYCLNKLESWISSISLCMIGLGMLSAPLNRLVFNSSDGDKGIIASIFYTFMMGSGAIIIKLFGYLEYTFFNFAITFFILALTQMLLFVITQWINNIEPYS